MARPSTPILTRERIVDTALRIIDEDGADAFSMARLAREFGVKSASLYYHVTDRDEVLRHTVRRIVVQAEIPSKKAPEDWIEWFVELAENVRRTLLTHPNTVHFLLTYWPDDLLVRLYENAEGIMRRAGIAENLIGPTLAGMEGLSISATITSAARFSDARDRSAAPEDPTRGDSVDDPPPHGLAALDGEALAQSVRSLLIGATVRSSVQSLH